MLKGEAPLTERPGAILPPVDLEATRTKLATDLGLDEDDAQGETVDDEDLNGYLMYPKVFMDYRARHRIYGPVRVLPTRTFFYGMEPGEEITAEIDPGKTLEIRLQAVGETDRRWRGAGVLRTERPAPRHPRAQPRRQGQDRRQAQGGRRQPRPCRRADARLHRQRRRDGWGRRSMRATCC